MILQSFFKASGYLWQGFKDLFSPGVRLYVIIPITLNALIFGISFYYGFQFISHKLNFLSFHINITWLEWLNPLFSALKIFLITIILTIYLAILVMISTFTAVIIAAPFNSFLSEALYRKIQQQSPPTISFLKVAALSFWRELIKFKYYIPQMVLAFCLAAILYFVPVLNILSSAVLILFGSWMLAVEYIDYPADNVQLKFNSLLKEMRSQRLLCLSYGFLVFIFSAIPFLNFIIMPIAVLGATRLWHAHLRGHASQPITNTKHHSGD